MKQATSARREDRCALAATAGMEIQGRCMAPLMKQLLGWDSASPCCSPQDAQQRHKGLYLYSRSLWLAYHGQAQHELCCTRVADVRPGFYIPVSSGLNSSRTFTLRRQQRQIRADTAADPTANAQASAHASCEAAASTRANTASAIPERRAGAGLAASAARRLVSSS